MKTYKQIINVALSKGLVLSVVDSEGVLSKRTTNKAQIIDAINSVEECAVRIYKTTPNQEPERMGTIYITENELSDFSDNEFINSLVR